MCRAGGGCGGGRLAGPTTSAEIAKGPQFAPRVIGKRVRGRPRKVKPAPGKVDEPSKP